MRERLEQILKIVCLALAVLLAAQLVKVAFHINPLAGVKVPEMPSLPADTNAVVKATDPVPAKPGTNAKAANVSKTNTPIASAETNAAPKAKAKTGGSNSSPVMASQPASTLAPATNSSGTNINNAETSSTANAVPKLVSETNAAPKVASNTNAPTTDTAGTNGTNAVIAKKSKPKTGALPGSVMGGPMMSGPGGKKAPGLPPEIQARVNRVTDSEILAPVVHPMPMALLGIAGKVAFLRSPSGQTGLVKEGDSLGEIKLLRIGINRVLIEQDGEQKELMIFSGYGGESLLPKPTDKSNETTTKN